MMGGTSLRQYLGQFFDAARVNPPMTLGPSLIVTMTPLGMSPTGFASIFGFGRSAATYMAVFGTLC